MATVVVSVLLVLSLVLMTTTVFPGSTSSSSSRSWPAGLVLALMVAGVVYARILRARPPVAVVAGPRRDTWRMPPLALLERPEWSAGRKRAMLVLRLYLVASVILLLVKAIQIG